MKSSPSKRGAGATSSCPHSRMDCFSHYSIALHHHYMVCTLVQREMLCSQNSWPDLTGSCTSNLILWVTEILESGKFCLFHSVSGFCALLFSSSLFTGYVLLICELLVCRISVPHGYLWFGFLHLSLFICINMYTSLHRTPAPKTEFLASLRVLPAVPVSASLHSHTSTEPVIEPFQWP